MFWWEEQIQIFTDLNHHISNLFQELRWIYALTINIEIWINTPAPCICVCTICRVWNSNEKHTNMLPCAKKEKRLQIWENRKSFLICSEYISLIAAFWKHIFPLQECAVISIYCKLLWLAAMFQFVPLMYHNYIHSELKSHSWASSFLKNTLKNLTKLSVALKLFPESTNTKHTQIKKNIQCAAQ